MPELELDSFTTAPLTRIQTHQKARIDLALSTAKGMRDRIQQIALTDAASRVLGRTNTIEQLHSCELLLGMASRVLTASRTRCWIWLHDAEQLLERVLDALDDVPEN